MCGPVGTLGSKCSIDSIRLGISLKSLYVWRQPFTETVKQPKVSPFTIVSVLDLPQFPSLYLKSDFVARLALPKGFAASFQRLSCNFVVEPAQVFF